ncbi:hypothetical protein BD408DRAFT_419349 [Parasitella parasitica]|nr:hypothetical protein BD408DRAFT_419349 [Parasitella parasitica]
MKTSITATLITLVATFFMAVQAAPAKLEARDSMSGDATYYSVGLGSCGDTNSDSELVAALSEELMGTGADGSYCGKSITLKGENGKSVSVKVVDSCPGCGKGDPYRLQKTWFFGRWCHSHYLVALNFFRSIRFCDWFAAIRLFII